MSYRLFLTSIVLIFLCVINFSVAFHEDAIFEDEDIYGQTLAPVTSESGSGLTFPGTKWCGPGDTAANYDDLGTQRGTDMCCRAHDHCSEIMESQKRLHELRNPDWFPRLTCECEQTFLNCLQRVNNAASNTIGRMYFGVRSSCFKEAYPIVGCVEYQKGTFSQRCIRYKFHNNRPKKWQFFDIPYYTQKN